MQIQNYEELQLGSEIFKDIRDSFDVLLQKLFKKMEDNNSDEGMIDLKLNIGIRTEWIPDQEAEGGSRQVNMPVIKHKITTQVPVKDALDGSKDTGMALVYDEELKRYVLKYAMLDGQMSIFDMEYPEKDEDAIEVDAIEGSERLMIEDKGTADDDGETGPEDADGGTETVEVADDEILEFPDENGADGDTEAYGGGYDYDEPVQDYDEPC